MSDNKDQCRAEFEAWAQKEGYNTSPHPTNGQYWDSHVEARWQGYSAGRAAQPVVLSDERCHVILHEMAEHMLTMPEDSTEEQFCGESVRFILNAVKEQA